MGVLATNVFNVKEKQAATGEGAEILVQNERDFEFAWPVDEQAHRPPDSRPPKPTTSLAHASS